MSKDIRHSSNGTGRMTSGSTRGDRQVLLPGETIRFLVLGTPVPQPRAKVTMQGGKGWGYVEKNHPIHAYREGVALSARIAWRGPLLTGPLRVRVTAIMPRPQRLIWKRKPMPREPHQGYPDVGNIVKGIEDALNGVLWVDDGQVYDSGGVKWIAGGDEDPHTIIEVWSFETPN